MAGQYYSSTSNFKPPQDKLKTEPGESYSVEIDDRNNEGKTLVYKNDINGNRLLLGEYPKRDTTSTTGGNGNFVRQGNAGTSEEFNYFFANGNYVINTYAAPLVTNAGGNSNQILGTNFASGQAPTASLSTNNGPPPPIDINNVESKPLSADISDSDNVRKNYGSNINLRYPIKRDAAQDYIQFSMIRYGSRNLAAISADTIGTTPISGPRAPKRTEETINGTVTLPIQPSISDSNGVDWGGANLNPIEAYFASMARGAMDMSGSVTDVLGSLMGKVQQNIKEMSTNPDLQNALKLYLTQEAVGVQGLLSRTTGAILNPNLELLFNGPSLRSFNFTFRLSPRNEEEANNVKRIIRFFKQGMSVKTSNTTVFLKAPNVFDIKYISSDGNNHKSLNRIKRCALLGCDVDYTPDGSYMTFNDTNKTMTSYQLSLRFSELDPIYEDDYFTNGLSDIEIGY
jgi:hypothetical protein